MPKVSVIIATYSRPHLLPRAVECARNAGSDVEVVVVDDASTDATAEVCRKLEGIRYVRLDANQHTAGARNVGLLVSTGEYISFHDDDDMRFPASLDSQIELLEKNPDAGLCHGPIFFGDDNCNPLSQSNPNNLITGDIFWEMLTRNPINCLSVVFRKSCLLRVGLLNPTISGIDDWDLWIRIAEFYTAIAVTEPVGIWRAATPSSLQGSSSPADLLVKYLSHLPKLMQLERVKTATKQQKKEMLQRLYDNSSDALIWLAATWLPDGANRYARRCLRLALQMNPRRAIRPWTFSLLLRSFLPLNQLNQSRVADEKNV